MKYSKTIEKVIASGPRIGSKSQLKGVYWNISVKKWVASITVNYKFIHIGYFDNIRDAAIAYNAKARELRGESAFQNIIPEE